ncbi:MAG TPA: Asp23/Gls24 family envelope stress response protein [Anaerolineales bacterium]|nr:Asp23/Gls24 family envelope stress response protein [Anaerolineales bacterium]
MSEETTPLGSILVAPRVVATIAYQAALESYGVVGLAPKNLITGLTNAVVKDPNLGIDVHYNGKDIDIDLYIVIEYGTRIKTVANSVANTVRFHVEKALGMPVNNINVHVSGLRISNFD